jgi:multidrug efflux pump subunit AcrB
VALGKRIFHGEVGGATCAGCHGSDAIGTPVGPDLASGKWLVAVGFYAAGHVATGFMPPVDEGGFVLDYYTKPGTSLTETGREIAQVEAIIKSMPEFGTFSRRLGTELGGGLGESYHGDFFVRLKPDHPARRRT